MKEIWKDVPEYEGKYQVSNCGRVISLRYQRSNKMRLLKPKIHTHGYLRVSLYKNSKPKDNYIHRLVLEAFSNNPENKKHCNHIDENKKNNNIDNLEWMTPGENNAHGTGTLRRGRSRKGKAVRSVRQLTLDGKLVKEWPSLVSTESEGCISSNVSSCCSGRNKTHRCYRWEYIT